MCPNRNNRRSLPGNGIKCWLLVRGDSILFEMYKITLYLDANHQVVQSYSEPVEPLKVPSPPPQVTLSPDQLRLFANMKQHTGATSARNQFAEQWRTAAPTHPVWAQVEHQAELAAHPVVEPPGITKAAGSGAAKSAPKPKVSAPVPKSVTGNRAAVQLPEEASQSGGGKERLESSGDWEVVQPRGRRGGSKQK